MPDETPYNKYDNAIDILLMAVEYIKEEKENDQADFAETDSVIEPYLKAVEALERVRENLNAEKLADWSQDNVFDLSTDVEADIAERDQQLIYAAGKGNLQEVTTLVEMDADVNAKDSMLEISVLMYAAMYGHSEVVKYLIKNGADINARSLYGDVALVYAALNKHREVVELFKEDKKAISTALMCAYQNGYTDAVEILSAYR